jgi:hypothetical protein
MVPTAQHKAILLGARATLPKPSRVYMIYLQNDTSASAELAPALLRHANPGPNAAIIPTEYGVAQFRGDWVFVRHIT